MDPQARITELEADLRASETDTRTMQIAYETALPREHFDAMRDAGDVPAKIAAAERLTGAAPAPAPAQSQARAPRDGLGRFSTRPAGFGGGTAPSGQPFSGPADGQHPADRAIRAAAEHPRASA